MSEIFKNFFGKLLQPIMSDDASANEEPIEQPIKPRRSARLVLMQERKRHVEQELNKRVETQLVQRLDNQLRVQRRTKYTRRLTARVEQLTEVPELEQAQQTRFVPLQNRPNKRKHNPNNGSRCVCTEINGEYYKLYDLPDDAEYIVPNAARGP
ncbi:uncharacterized protein Dvir_GJ20910 [Drosophila virilis]|uniref:Uncharacterized protein n=2 Tax=Drosophila virilis TaxID=7244 RepID=B4LQ17_DROVI|nr:uncharacterized protein LOC6626458 [Drosophila virilis]EDW60340.2 uncharacterized protein Dvir_GJ20910 [Drosophila virilis]